MKTKLIALALSSMVLTALAAGDGDLKQGFLNPPQSARPQVWWHWMNGNITKEGIRKDLDWMHRIGIGGIHHFDAGTNRTPQIVPHRLIYMHDDWQDAFRYAINYADSLGMAITVASAPGWSATGGPWVTPDEAMKKLVWRTSTIAGGRKVRLTLPEPFRNPGVFQDGPTQDAGGLDSAYTKDHYKDIAVLAVRQPKERREFNADEVKVTASGGEFNYAQLSDGSIKTSGMLPINEGKQYGWVQYAFPHAVTVKSVSLATTSRFTQHPLEVSDDGITFRKVCDVTSATKYAVTSEIPVTTARYFRLLMDNPKKLTGMAAVIFPSAPVKGTDISEFVLYPYSCVNRAEEKAGFNSTPHLALMPTTAEGEAFPQTADVIDVTQYVDANGVLQWKAPKGNWKVYRFGWSLTGKMNHPAPAEATGLEVDKLDRVAFGRYLRHYLDMYRKVTNGKMGKEGISHMLADSYEAGFENWTPAMFSEFKTRRGYDLLPWLPALTGEIICSPEKTDAFLHDWRETLAELVADSYAQMSDIVRREYGMAGGYYESHEGYRAYVADGMDVKRTADVPMGAMWTQYSTSVKRNADGSVESPGYSTDDRESASVAHIYGQNLTAAESFTSVGNFLGEAYSYSPSNLKAVADYELWNGINRFVIHESSHVPDDAHMPGLSLLGTGQWFNRHETWAEMAKPWIDYLARSSYMLQQGRNVADVLFYYGEDSNVCSEFVAKPAGVPAGFEYDFCNPTALLKDITAKDGRLIVPSGNSYKLLWMDRNVEYMSVKVLRAIRSLVEQGVQLGGVRPQHPASAADSAEEFAALVSDIFDSGRTNVHETSDIKVALAAINAQPDVTMPEGFHYLHRDAGETQIYWVSKPTNSNWQGTLSFNISGRKPMLWHADDGSVEEVSYRMTGSRTEVDLNLKPTDAVFVVFNGKAEQSYTAATTTEQKLTEIGGTWTVKFQEHRGAPAETKMDRLASLTESDDPGIKYFSGIATYTNTFNLNAQPKGRIEVLLGEVKDIAEVYVNGEYCGTAWKKPYAVDITKAVSKGRNTIEVRVANPWANRIIGDQQPDCKEKITFTDTKYYFPESPLRTAGLMGPVTVINKK